MTSVEIVKSDELQLGYVTEGITRAKAFESDATVFSRTAVSGNTKSGWHHHGKRELYAYVVSGHLKLEFGPKGESSADAFEGDFVHVAPGVVHRDVNPDALKELVIVNVLVGNGVPVVNVDGPEGKPNISGPIGE